MSAAVITTKFDLGDSVIYRKQKVLIVGSENINCETVRWMIQFQGKILFVKPEELEKP
jgi:hypothetical protein